MSLGMQGEGHKIRFVGDDELPEGHDFVLVLMPDNRAHIFYRESALSPQSLMDSWSAYREALCERQAVPVSHAAPLLRLA